jgi:hypothetical protein
LSLALIVVVITLVCRHQCLCRRFAEMGFSDPPGKVYRYSASNGKLDCLIINGINPNGLALSPGESVLYFGQDQRQATARVIQVTSAKTDILHSPPALGGHVLYKEPAPSPKPVDFASRTGAQVRALKVDSHVNLFNCHPSIGCVYVVNPRGFSIAIVERYSGLQSHQWLF